MDSFTLTTSRVGIPSVIQITSLTPESRASSIESIANAAGTNTRDTSAPVSRTASDMVSKTGNPFDAASAFSRSDAANDVGSVLAALGRVEKPGASRYSLHEDF